MDYYLGLYIHSVLSDYSVIAEVFAVVLLKIKVFWNV
jgi:hypothetical protein